MNFGIRARGAFRLASPVKMPDASELPRFALPWAHNLKAAGSNPAPATKKRKYISCLEPDVNRRVFAFAILVNTWSTFDEPPSTGLFAFGGQGSLQINGNPGWGTASSPVLADGGRST